MKNKISANKLNRLSELYRFFRRLFIDIKNGTANLKDSIEYEGYLFVSHGDRIRVSPCFPVEGELWYDQGALGAELVAYKREIKVSDNQPITEVRVSLSVRKTNQMRAERVVAVMADNPNDNEIGISFTGIIHGPDVSVQYLEKLMEVVDRSRAAYDGRVDDL